MENLRKMLKLIDEIAGSGEISIERLRQEAKNRDIYNSDEIIDRLARDGNLFYPRSNVVKKL